MPITWKNVNAVSNHSANQLADRGLDRLTAGVEGLANQAEGITEENKKEAETKRNDLITALKGDLVNMDEDRLNSIISGDSSVGTEYGLKAGELRELASGALKEKQNAEITSTQRDILVNDLQQQQTAQKERPTLNAALEQVAEASTVEELVSLRESFKQGGLSDQLTNSSEVFEKITARIKGLGDRNYANLLKQQSLNDRAERKVGNRIMADLSSQLMSGTITTNEAIKMANDQSASSGVPLPSNYVQTLRGIGEQSKQLEGELQSAFTHDNAILQQAVQEYKAPYQSQVQALTQFEQNNSDFLALGKSIVKSTELGSEIGKRYRSLVENASGIITDLPDKEDEKIENINAIRKMVGDVQAKIAKERGIEAHEVPIHPDFLTNAMQANTVWYEDDAFTDEGDDYQELFKNSLETQIKGYLKQQDHYETLKSQASEAARRMSKIDGTYATEAKKLQDLYINQQRANISGDASAAVAGFDRSERLEQAKAALLNIDNSNTSLTNNKKQP